MKYINSNKLNTLKMNENNTYFVIDFDRTITGEKSKDSWDIARKTLGTEIKKDMNNFYKKYRPIEINYTISLEEKTKAMEEWYGNCMNLYYKYHLTKNKLIESVKTGNLSFRKGVKEFLKYANDKNIPIIILSAGIGNVIEQFLKKENSFFNNIHIISNFIEFDTNGEIKEFDYSKIIHTLNKSLLGKLKDEQQKEIKNRPYKILVGDMIEDVNMINKDEWNTTLKIGMINEETKELIKIYNEYFDIVLTEEDACFEEIEKIIA